MIVYLTAAGEFRAESFEEASRSALTLTGKITMLRVTRQSDGTTWMLNVSQIIAWRDTKEASAGEF